MFEFDTDGGWEVSQEADSLSKSLFGSSKKSKNKRKEESKAATSNKSHSLIPDSDDEIFTKKGLRKLKEKRRRKKKQGKKDESEADEIPAPNVDEKEENVKPTKADKQNKYKKTDAHSDAADEKVKPKKRKNVSNEDGEESPEIPKKKKKKTKETNGVNETALESSPVSTEETPKKKRKRQRKKKNNSKKNKYAHLALNRKENKVEVTAENNTEESSGDVRKSALSPEKPMKDNDVSTISNKPLETSMTSGKGNLKPDKASLQVEVNKKSKKLEKMDSISTENKKKRKIDSALTPAKQSKSMKISEEQNTNTTVASNIKKNKKDKDRVDNEKNNGVEKNTFDSVGGEIGKEKDSEKVDSKKMIKLQQRQKTLLKALGKSREVNEEKGSNKITNERKRKKEKTPKGLENASPDSKPQNTKSGQKKQSGKSSLSKAEAQTNQNSAKLESKENVDKNKSIWGKKNSSLGNQAQEKLNAARFRYLNEQLYTCQGKDALEFFREDPEAFEVYHTGFENQASKWPVNPVNVLIKQIIAKSPHLVVADFGCGDAKLAQALPQKVHSFDLVAINPRVKACDMSNVPLKTESVDIAVFCLSLMGTNLDDYVSEANRVLKTDGLLKIVEVSSRFKGLSSFLASVCSHGFQLLNKRDLSQMFYLMDFKKVKLVKKGASTKNVSLKPCLYKKR